MDKKTILTSGTWGTKQSFTNRLITTTQSEHIYSSPLWKKYSANRCLIPVSAYFEWQMQLSGKKHKFKIEFIDKDSYFGGLWGYNPGDDNTWVTIVTQVANEKTAEIHNYGDNKHRQPIVIRRENRKRWIDPGKNSESEIKNIITQFQQSEIITDDLDYEQTLFG
nr:SOS response-associated peptidase family protein [Leptospira congkakensis]